MYEAAAEFSEIGAGISVRPRTLRFMRELGLLEDLLAISGKHADRDGTRNASILVWGRLVTRFFARTRIFFFQCR